MNLIARSALGLAVCATLSTAAQAFPRTDYPAAAKIYFGGATATDNVLEAAFLSLAPGTGICDTVIGNIDIYRSTGQRVITCYVSNDNTPGHGFATRAAGGTRIAFHKESNGGSSNGVNPLLAVSKGQAHTLRWLNVGALVNNCTVVNQPATAQLSGYVDHQACDATALTPVDTAASSTYDANGGISDVEPKLAYPAPTDSDLARLLSNPGIAVVFGVPVSTNLYRALQKAQFGNGSSCDGSDATNCVPSMTRAQIRAVYSQNVADWNEFKSASGVALTAVPGVVAPTDEYARICRRVATSGTQAGAESYFLNERCVAGVPTPFALPDDSSGITDTAYSPNEFLAGSLVNAGPGSGDVRTCLASANANGFWALGVLSTEITDSNYNSGNGGFRFVAIDGAAPNLTNVANGDYDYFTENTINRIASGAGALANGDVRREVIEVIDERLGNTAALASLNQGFDGRPWGNGGVLALSSVSTTSTAPYSDAEMTASPVNTQSRGGNNCAPPVMVKAQPVNGTPNP